MKKKKKMYLAMTLIIAILFGFSSCVVGEEKNAGNDGDDKLLIGFSMGTLLEDRWVRDRDIFLGRAQEQNVDVIVTNANKNSELQYEHVKDMLSRGIDVLVLAPHDSTSEQRCVKLAAEKGIPVIAYDRLILNANVDAYVSFDNNEVGVLMASSLLEAVPKGGYLLVGGSSNDSNSATIMEGVNSVLDPQIKQGNIEILDQTWIDGWVREDAYEFTKKSIDTFGEKIDGIIVWNDSMAWGVIDALSEAQMAEDVSVVGQDADLVACRRIVQGQQLMTVYKPIKTLVDETMKLCITLGKGEPIPKGDTINDGTFDVPHFTCGVIAVTESNMKDTVIKDGFHLSKEIYSQGGD